MQFKYEPIQYLNNFLSDTIRCRVTGGPMPEVSWSFNGTDIGKLGANIIFQFLYNVNTLQ